MKMWVMLVLLVSSVLVRTRKSTVKRDLIYIRARQSNRTSTTYVGTGG